MAFTKTRLLNYLGFVQWGDLAELTLYRDRYRQLVVYPKQYPKGVPSARTIAVRSAFLAAITAWKALTQNQQAQWRLAARRSNAKMTGYNLFLSYFLKPDPAALATIERQTYTALVLT